MNRTILRIGAAAVVIAVLFPPFQHFLLDSRAESSKKGGRRQAPPADRGISTTYQEHHQTRPSRCHFPESGGVDQRRRFLGHSKSAFGLAT